MKKKFVFFLFSPLFLYPKEISFLEKGKNACFILQKSYPESIKNCSDEFLILSDDRKILLYDSLLKRDIESMASNPDVLSVFYFPYNQGIKNDAGRARLYPLLEITYGKTKKEVQKNLKKLDFLGQTLFFNIKNGAYNAFQKIILKLKKLIQKKPELKKYLLPAAGTFSYRKISGTDRYSAHSFGIAVDLNVKYSDYWLWHKDWEKQTYSYPVEIVKIFESEGFIWGGRWEHFDTMHFEYRPEFQKKD
ncbi:MAG TPA: hypothetical protein DHW82_00170 [Spirochaetia bacterium]|nr:MAG: hypothetical protein A2Y41_02260 [Spirochaetes bacterium GWB1_36_13]HCL55416.1 hypothetical protein [Spirochaetia bacterium]